MFACANRQPFLLVVLLVALSLGVATSAQSTQEETPTSPTHVESERVVALFEAFASMSGLEATFTEEKHLSLLARPLESRGTLYFDPAGFMLRQIEEPSAASVLVTPERVRVSENGSPTEEFDLEQRPEVRDFVAPFLWILSGDHDRLTEAYEVRFESEAEAALAQAAWTLTLIPSSERLAHILQRITVEGNGYAVQTIRVVETNGDETLTRIMDANPTRTFSDSEKRELFGLSPE